MKSSKAESSRQSTPSCDLSRRQFLGRCLAVAATSTVRPIRAASDSGWSLGCYTRPWAEFNYRIALDAIAEAGFSGAGLMTTKAPNRLVLSVATSMKEAEQIGEELKRRKLRGLSAYVGSLPKTVEAGTDALRGLIDKAVAAGVGSLLMGGVGDAAAAEAYYGAIARCCDYAAEHRIEIALKPHGGLNATGPQCRKTIESIHHPAFRLWYDPGNIFYYSDGKRDPVEDSATVDGLVTGMCVKDFRPPKDVDVTPGTGRVDFHGVLSRLRQGGFRGGPLVVETLAPGNRSETLEQAKQARMFLEKLIREL